jgi:hypothetical protein
MASVTKEQQQKRTVSLQTVLNNSRKGERRRRRRKEKKGKKGKKKTHLCVNSQPLALFQI